MDQNQFPQYNQFPQDQYPKEKERHGCVTAYLIVMIIANSIVALIYFLASEFVTKNLPNHVSKSIIFLLGFLGLANIAFAILLLKFKRWGFYGFIGTAIAGFLINLQMRLPILQVLAGLLGIGVLFAVLQAKKDGLSAWEQMD